jgi:Na+-driven multidrug efflux pump
MGVMFPTTVVGTASIVLTVVCNYIFIYGIFGIPGLGFIGVHCLAGRAARSTTRRRDG